MHSALYDLAGVIGDQLQPVLWHGAGSVMRGLYHFFHFFGYLFHTAYKLGIEMAGSLWVLPLLALFCFIDGVAPLLPSETLMIGLGSLWHSGRAVNIVLVAVAGAVGAFAGDITAYHLGRLIPLRKVPGFRGSRGRKRILWAKNALAKRGTVFILAARFIPLGRVAVNMTAGATNYPRGRFIPTCMVAAVIWSGYSVTLGAVAAKLVHDSPIIAIVVGVASGILFGKLMDYAMGRFSSWWYGEKYDLTKELDETEETAGISSDADPSAANAENEDHSGESGVEVVETGNSADSPGNTTEGPDGSGAGFPEAN